MSRLERPNIPERASQKVILATMCRLPRLQSSAGDAILELLEEKSGDLVKVGRASAATRLLLLVVTLCSPRLPSRLFRCAECVLESEAFEICKKLAKTSRPKNTAVMMRIDMKTDPATIKLHDVASRP